MRPLSEQLAELSAQAKKAEDRAAKAQSETKERLEERPNLVGTELFRDFQEVSPKVWKGKVFVPDLNHTFSGTGTLVDANTIVARGCAVGNVGCKSQTWTKVDNPNR